MSVARVTEISSTSTQSFEDAIIQGIARAAETDDEGRFIGYGPPGMWVRPILYNPPTGYAAPPRVEGAALPQAKLDAAAPHTFADIKLRPATVLRARGRGTALVSPQTCCCATSPSIPSTRPASFPSTARSTGE